MQFNGIHGIDIAEFEKMLREDIDPKTRKLRSLMSELKRVIRYRQLDSFIRDNRELENDVKEIVMLAIKEFEGDENTVGYLKKSALDNWVAYIRRDGSIDTNISFDKTGWENLTDIWVGLNSIVGKKVDGTLIQVGSDSAICNHKNAKKVVTASYMQQKAWAVQNSDDTWIYSDGRTTKNVKYACLSMKTGQIEYSE